MPSKGRGSRFICQELKDDCWKCQPGRAQY